MDNWGNNMEIINPVSEGGIEPRGAQCTTLCLLPGVYCLAISCGMALLGIVIATAAAPYVALLGGAAGDIAGDETAAGQ